MCDEGGVMEAKLLLYSNKHAYMHRCFVSQSECSGETRIAYDVYLAPRDSVPRPAFHPPFLLIIGLTRVQRFREKKEAADSR